MGPYFDGFRGSFIPILVKLMSEEGEWLDQIFWDITI